MDGYPIPKNWTVSNPTCSLQPPKQPSGADQVLNPEYGPPQFLPITEATVRYHRTPLHFPTPSIAVSYSSKPLQFPTTLVAVPQNSRIPDSKVALRTSHLPMFLAALQPPKQLMSSSIHRSARCDPAASEEAVGPWQNLPSAFRPPK
jgi:hypothetical protein